MHVYLTARHFELTDSIRKYVEQHLVREVERHADAHELNRIEVQLSLGQRDARFGCHVLVQLPQHRDINVTEENLDLYAAIAVAQKRVLHALSAERERRQAVERQAKQA